MKFLTILITLCVSTLFLSCSKSNSDKSQSINLIIGDISFESKFGHKPNSSSDDQIRIITHLEYVEKLLRNKDISDLSPELQKKRGQTLDLLHDYWTAGLFPKNYDFLDQRKSCFIDKEGTICAVGYLVEKTTNRTIAEQINSKYQYDAIMNMEDSFIDEWITTCGLTKVELAMIQPMYNPNPPNNSDYVDPEYKMHSYILSGINLSLSAVNTLQIRRTSQYKAAPYIGLISGAGQVVLGSVHFPKGRSILGNLPYTNESKTMLSYINIGIGTATMFLSAYNLSSNKMPKERLTSWNLYHFPAHDNTSGIAFSFTRKF